MNDKAKIDALTKALKAVMDANILTTAAAYQQAKQALALTADASEQAPNGTCSAIRPPELPKYMPDFCDTMSKEEVWDYACLSGWRTATPAPIAEQAPDDAVTLLRDALYLMLCQFTGTPSTLADSNARCKAHEALARTATAPAAPVADTGAVADAERIAHLEGEEEISEAVIGTMSRLLASIAITLKGEEAALRRHSYHDLAELVKVMALELDLYKTIYGEKVPEGWDSATPASTATADSAADARDAMRYRWLLGHYARGDGYSDIDAALNDGEPEKYLSPAIDAAIASMHPTTGDKE